VVLEGEKRAVRVENMERCEFGNDESTERG